MSTRGRVFKERCRESRRAVFDGFWRRVMDRPRSIALGADATSDSDESFPRADRWIGLVLLAVALALRLLYIFTYKFDSDEPQHLHVAWGWAHGLMQYRDVFDNHAPLFHLLCSLPVRWLGDRADLLILMRLAMLPLYALTLWGTYRIARALFSARLAWWAACLAGLLPRFFLHSVEFRADDLWAALFVAALAVLLGGRLVWRRGLLGGLLLGASLGASIKTGLLVPCGVAAGLATVFLCGGPNRARLFNRQAAACLFAFLAGCLVVPVTILAWFHAQGALGDLYYGTVQHNMLPGLGVYKSHTWKQLPMLPAIALLWLVSRYVIVPRGRGQARTAPYNFVFLLAGLHIAAVMFLWPIIAEQDFLPAWPLAVIAALPLLDRPLPWGRWWRTRHPGRWMGSGPCRGAFLLAAAAEVAYLLLAAPGIGPGKQNQTGTALAGWRAVLALTTPAETVMDPKGELIFRRRPFYWGMEAVTRERMRRGLIANTIAADLAENRTCVVYRALERYPAVTQQFIDANYLSIGPVLVAGQRLKRAAADGIRPISFDVKIPVEYALVTPRGGASGELDGTPYRGPVLLPAGVHEYQPAPAEDPPVLVWARAIGRGFSPFPESGTHTEASGGRWTGGRRTTSRPDRP